MSCKILLQTVYEMGLKGDLFRIENRIAEFYMSFMQMTYN